MEGWLVEPMRIRAVLESGGGFLGVGSVVFSFYRLNSRLMKVASSDYLLP